MASEICNIGESERRKRRILGIVTLTVGIATAFILLAYEAPRVSRIIVFFPFWLAGLGLFQSKERICISLAARDLRNMDAGEEKINDQKLNEKLRLKAREINRRAIITALITTLVTILFPQNWQS
jgi:hypothetical protein